MKKLNLIILLFISSLIYAQNDFEGVIKYSIAYEDLSEEVKAYESMLPKETTFEIKDEMTKVTIPNAMGGEMIVISDVKSGKSLVLQNVMGNKIAIKSAYEDLKEEERPVIEYIDEEKEIAGYNCKKAIMKINGMESVIYYTEDIKGYPVSDKDYQLKGMAVQTIEEMDGAYTKIITLKSIEKVKVKAFKLDIPEGYTEMSLEQIREMGMGM